MFFSIAFGSYEACLKTDDLLIHALAGNASLNSEHHYRLEVSASNMGRAPQGSRSITAMEHIVRHGQLNRLETRREIPVLCLAVSFFLLRICPRALNLLSLAPGLVLLSRAADLLQQAARMVISNDQALELGPSGELLNDNRLFIRVSIGFLR